MMLVTRVSVNGNRCTVSFCLLSDISGRQERWLFHRQSLRRLASATRVEYHQQRTRRAIRFPWSPSPLRVLHCPEEQRFRGISSGAPNRYAREHHLTPPWLLCSFPYRAVQWLEPDHDSLDFAVTHYFYLLVLADPVL